MGREMKTESGRSLIEIIGVLTITAVMTAATIAMYNTIRKNQTHTIASAELCEVVKNIKLLFDMCGDYTGVSVDWLVKTGALKNDKAPLGESWSIEPTPDASGFVINLRGLSHSNCDFLAVSAPSWASSIIVNGQENESSPICFSGNTNNITFIAQ